MLSQLSYVPENGKTACSRQAVVRERSAFRPLPSLATGRRSSTTITDRPRPSQTPAKFPSVRAPRFELGTSALSGPRSNQLSYARDTRPRSRRPAHSVLRARYPEGSVTAAGQGPIRNAIVYSMTFTDGSGSQRVTRSVQSPFVLRSERRARRCRKNRCDRPVDFAVGDGIDRRASGLADARPTIRPYPPAASWASDRRANPTCRAVPIGRAASSTLNRGWWTLNVEPTASFRMPRPTKQPGTRSA